MKKDLELSITTPKKLLGSGKIMLESLGESLIAVDRNEKVMMINSQAKKLLGINKADVSGAHYETIFPIEDENGVPVLKSKNPFKRAINTGKTVTALASTTKWYLHSRHHKKRCPIALTVTPIIVDKRIVGAVALFHDVTHEKEIDQAKDDFISLASHQLRTAPTVINWSSELLLDKQTGQLNKKQHQLFDAIYRSNQEMVGLINSFLDVSKIEANNISINPEPTDIVTLIRDILDKDLKFQIMQKQLQIKEEYEINPLVLNIDPKLTKVVIGNIISNAIKYTAQKGKIDISLIRPTKKIIKKFSQSKGKNWLIQVADSGYGIPKNQQQYIFTKLFRADNVKSKDTSGTGLGLYIAKSILEQCGGNIWFESKKDKGTTFFIYLPPDSKKRPDAKNSTKVSKK